LCAKQSRKLQPTLVNGRNIARFGLGCDASVAGQDWISRNIHSSGQGAGVIAVQVGHAEDVLDAAKADGMRLDMPWD
jgi:hypothetical protein